MKKSLILGLSIILSSSICQASSMNNKTMFENDILSNVYIEGTIGYGFENYKNLKDDNGFMTSLSIGYQLNEVLSLEGGLYSFPNIGDMELTGGDNYMWDASVKMKTKMNKINPFVKLGIGYSNHSEEEKTALFVSPGIEYSLNDKVSLTLQESITAPLHGESPWVFGTLAGFNFYL